MTRPSELAALDDEEFLDELQENLALDDFTAFLADDVAARTRTALVDLKQRTVALAQVADDPDLKRRRRRFAMLVDSRLSAATVAMKNANRRLDTGAQVVKYAAFAERLCAELAKSDRAYALDFIDLDDGLSAATWLEIREGKHR